MCGPTFARHGGGSALFTRFFSGLRMIIRRLNSFSTYRFVGHRAIQHDEIVAHAAHREVDAEGAHCGAAERRLRSEVNTIDCPSGDHTGL